MKKTNIPHLLRLALGLACLALAGCTLPGSGPQPNTAPDVSTLRIATAKPLAPQQVVPVVSNYLAAMVAESSGDMDKAATYYLANLKADPDNAMVRDRAFSLLLATGRMDDTVKVARQIKKAGDAMPLVYLVLFYDHALDGNLKAARADLADMRAISPNLIQFELLKASLDVADGTPVKQVLAHLEGLNPGPGMVVFKYLRMGRLYERMGDLKKAQESYLKGHMLDPSSVFLVLHLGQVYEQQGKVKEARALYDNFLSLHPESLLLGPAMERLKTHAAPPRQTYTLRDDLADVSFDLATIMVGQNIDLTAQQFLQLSLWADPHRPFSLFSMGLVYDQQSSAKQAMAYYQKVPAGSAPYMAARIRMAQLVYAQGNHKQAMLNLEKMLKAHNEDVIRLTLAQMNFDQHDYKAAIGYYTQLMAHANDQQQADYYFARGAAYERSGNIKAASADMLKSIHLDPENASTLNYLGYMWIDKGINTDKAYKLIYKAAQLRPDDGAIIDSLGWAYFKRGDFSKAVDFLEQAVTMEPTDATITGHLGDAYNRVGRTREAQVMWKRALTLKPDTAERKRLEASLKQVQAK